MYCSEVSLQALLDCFDNDLENTLRIMYRSWSIMLQEIAGNSE